jgi:hypothetical protein
MDLKEIRFVEWINLAGQRAVAARCDVYVPKRRPISWAFKNKCQYLAYRWPAEF